MLQKTERCKYYLIFFLNVLDDGGFVGLILSPDKLIAQLMPASINRVLKQNNGISTRQHLAKYGFDEMESLVDEDIADIQDVT